MNLENSLKTNKEGLLTNEQIEFMDLYLKSVARVFSRAGYSPQTEQVSFKLTLFRHSLNPNQVESILPKVEEVISLLKPVKVHDKVKDQFKAIMIVDSFKGSKGSYSLLINKNGRACVYLDDRFEPSFITKWNTLKETLNYIAKNNYFYQTPIKNKT